MTITHNFTSGGQVAMHRLRMIQQNVLVTLSISLIISLLSFGTFLYVRTSTQDWYLTSQTWYAQFLLSTTAAKDAGRITQDFNDFDGRTRKVSCQTLVHNPYIKSRVAFVYKTLKQGSMLSIGLFLISVAGVMIFFSRRGKVERAKRLERGNIIIEPDELSQQIHKSNQASDLTIGPLPLIKDKETSHMLITGTTGSGKTNVFHSLLPQIRSRQNRAIVVDLNGDLIARYYNPETDIILNPLDERSQPWNPWIECESFAQFDQLVTSFIPSLPSANRDPFWDNAARSLLVEALHKLKKKNINSNQMLYQILSQIPLTDFEAFFKDTKAAAFADSKGERTTISIRSHLTSYLSPFRVLEDTDEPFSIRSWITDEGRENELTNNDKPSWLFLTAQPEQRASLIPLISTWLDISLNALMGLTPDQKRRLWFVVDELPALKKLSCLEMALAESRKYGGCILAGLQSVPQLTTLYGASHAQTLLDLFNTYVFLRNSDPQTSSWVSKVLGESELKEIQENLSFGANAIRDGVSFNQQTRTRPLVMPTEIASLNDLESYIKLPGNWPITKLKMEYQNRPVVAQSLVPSFLEDIPLGDIPEELFVRASRKGTAENPDVNSDETPKKKLLVGKRS